MTHPDPLTRAVQAALDAAADFIDGPESSLMSKHMMAGAIRAIDPAEVLAKVGDGWPEINAKQRVGYPLDAVERLVEAANNIAPWISASISDPYSPACAEYTQEAEALLKAISEMENSDDRPTPPQEAPND